MMTSRLELVICESTRKKLTRSLDVDIVMTNSSKFEKDSMTGGENDDESPAVNTMNSVCLAPTFGKSTMLHKLSKRFPKNRPKKENALGPEGSLCGVNNMENSMLNEIAKDLVGSWLCESSLSLRSSKKHKNNTKPNLFRTFAVLNRCSPDESNNHSCDGNNTSFSSSIVPGGNHCGRAKKTYTLPPAVSFSDNYIKYTESQPFGQEYDLKDFVEGKYDDDDDDDDNHDDDTHDNDSDDDDNSSGLLLHEPAFNRLSFSRSGSSVTQTYLNYISSEDITNGLRNRQKLFPTSLQHLEPNSAVAKTFPEKSKSVDLNTPEVSHSKEGKTGRCVRFDTVDVRVYERTLGDNPACEAHGPSMSLDWNYQPTERFKVDDWESGTIRCGKYRRLRRRRRRRRRTTSQLVMTCRERQKIAMRLGFTREEIARNISAIQKIQQQRLSTLTCLHFGFSVALEDAVERARQHMVYALGMVTEKKLLQFK